MKDTRKMIVVLALAALNVAIGFGESYIPAPISAIPFVKIELSLFVALTAVTLYGPLEGVLVYGVKCLVMGLILKSPSLIIYTIVASVVCFGLYYLCLWAKCGVLPAAFVGGVGYALGYYSMVAAVLANGAVFNSFPIAALFLGAVTMVWGVPAFFINKYVPREWITSIKR